MMKTFLIAFLTLILFKANANTYYFSSVSGSDSRTALQAQSPTTPWKTLEKFNAIVSNLMPGDVVLFKRGETFFGSIRISKSGTASLPITIGAYGTGANPVISGLQSVTNWVRTTGNIYESSCTDCLPNLNLVTFQDTLQPLGRWPKATAEKGGYLALNSHSGTSLITSTLISSAPNFVGGEVVIRPYGWIINRARVLNQTASEVTYNPITSPSHPNFTYEPQNGYGFFFQNHVNALTNNGDWMYDINTKKLKMYFSSDPSGYSVKASRVETVINVDTVSNIVFDGLSFTGANSRIVDIDTSANITINNCEISLSGVDGIYVSKNSNGITVKNSIISSCANNGISANNSTNWVIQKNIVRSIGRHTGMGLPGDGTYNAISHTGNNSVIEFNEIKNTGYNGIDFGGESVLIRNNFIDSFCLVKSDGGGVYNAFESDKKNRKIIGNIITNGLGNRYGRSQGEIDNPYSGNIHGIYMDLGASEAIIEGNTVANCANSGLQLSSSLNTVVTNNTFFNNTTTQVFYYETFRNISNLTFKNNILFSKKSDQLISLVRSNSNVIRTWGVVDSNFYCRPVSEPQGVDTVGYSHAPTLFDYPDGGIIQAPGERFYSLDNWIKLSGQDANTKKTPDNATDLNSLRFEYNPTSTPKTIALSGVYFDMRNQFYNGSITLAPYTSAILLRKVGGAMLDQTITFDTIVNKTFGDAAFTVRATASSGLPVSYRVVSGPATLKDSVVTITGAGNVIIEATQVGDGLYNSAAPVSRSFTVLKKNQNISFGSLPNKTYGDAPFSLNATATSGLPVSYRVVSGPATISDNIVTMTNAGTAVIEASQVGDANYNPANVVTQNLIINPAAAPTGCTASGNILREEWINIFGTAVSDIPLHQAPAASSLINKLETENTGDWMGARIRGYICPPATGDYHFYIAGDDGVELWLSTDDNPSNKVKIAGYIGWTGFREWDKYPSQKSSPINLVAGRRYYIEVLHKNGSGGDNVSVRWDLPNGTSEAPIPGSRLSPFGAPATQKANQTINFAPLPSSTLGDAPFSLNATATSGLPVSYRVVSGPATVDGNVVTVNATGTVVIEASQPGNNYYNAAPPVTQSFVVNSAVPPGGNACSATGSILREQWENVFGIEVSNIPLNTKPTGAGSIYKLETENTGPNMGARIRGYVCPPISGHYTFYIAGDDGVELWLSTNDDPANKVKIAGYSGWTGFREWDKYPGQKSQLINLQVGHSYYIEVLHKNGGGGDNVSVKWVLPNGVTEAPIPGNRLSPFTLASTSKLNQTINFPSIGTKTYGTAPFTLAATATSGLPVSYRIVSGPATVSGNTVTLTGEGVVQVEASQAGNATYNAAPVVVNTFNVAPAVDPGSGCSATGTILREQWDNVYGTNVSDIPLHTNPTATQLLSVLETEDTGPWMGARIRGYICPPTSGDYTFYIAGDDGVELWLSTNDKLEKKVKIAGYVGWTGFREWDKYPSQKSAPIFLQAGQKYYIEVLHKNGGGGDNVSVKWELPNGTTEAPIPGSRLSPYQASSAPITFGQRVGLPVEVSKQKSQVSIYPNPFYNVTKITVKAVESGEGTLMLYDLHGRPVKQIFKGNFEGDQAKTITLTLDGLTHGVYFVRFITKTDVVTQRVSLGK